MSFEIVLSSGETRSLCAADSSAAQIPEVDGHFVDRDGAYYAASFDGTNVIFTNGGGDLVGHWVQGTSATVIKNTRKLAAGFSFTFVDHGPSPQRLHALWRFNGSVDEAVAGWKPAGFHLSNIDRRLNRNHPASIHLRTKGAFGTGADSSHVTIPLIQAENCTVGEIHIGEFNPLTGFGVGFVLHHLERWM